MFITGKLRYTFLSAAEVDLKDKIMLHLLSGDILSFKSREPAYYINLLLTDTDTWREDYLDTIPLICNALVTIVASAFMLFTFHPLLLFSGIAMAIISMFVIKPFTKTLTKRTEEFSESAEKYNQHLKEIIDGYEAIRMSRQEKQLSNRFSIFSLAKQEAWKQLTFLRYMSFETLMFAASLSSIVALGIGAYLVYKGYFVSALIFTIINYFTGLSNQMSNLSSLLVSLNASKTIKKALYRIGTSNDRTIRFGY